MDHENKRIMVCGSREKTDKNRQKIKERLKGERNAETDSEKGTAGHS